MSQSMVQVKNNSKWDENDLNEIGFLRSTFIGIGTPAVAAGDEPIQCQANQVALIDEIVLTAKINDASTNVTVWLHVNGRTTGLLGSSDTVDPHVLPFHFPGHIDNVRTEQIVLRPVGNLVVSPSSTLWVQSNTAVVTHAQIRYRKKHLSAALRDGDISTNATMPKVASTNSVTGSGTSAATAKAIVAVEAGMAIEVLGFYLTGHNYNTATDDIRLGFWDGTTGTFAANGSMIMRGFAKGVASHWSPRILVNNTGGCIQGPVGEGLYIQASTNLAGATPTADYVVMYRKVKAVAPLVSGGVADAGGSTTTMVDSARTEAEDFWIGKQIRFTSGTNMGLVRHITRFVASTDTMTFAPAALAAVGAADTYDILSISEVATPTGVVGAIPIGRKKFWNSTEADGGVQVTKLFASGTVLTDLNQHVRILGHAGSVVCAENALSSPVGIGVGTGTDTLSEFYVFNGSGAAAAVSGSFARENLNTPIPYNSEPNFFCLEADTNVIQNRFQLAWGKFSSKPAIALGTIA